MSGINKKLLTIIIPTYNRKMEVQNNLERTIPMVLKYKSDVNIYVSDNASTDGTKEMVEEYVDKYPDVISYFCQHENLTASPNFNHAVHAVNSEYCYILGDDDFIFSGFLPTVMDLIKHFPDVGLFHFNYILGFRNGERCKLQYSKIGNDKLLFNEGINFLWDFLDGPSFVSSNLFKRSLWLDGATHLKEDCYGYVWLSILCYGLLKYKCMYISQPLLYQGFPKIIRYSSCFPLYHFAGMGNLFKYMDKYKNGIYSHWIEMSQVKRMNEAYSLITDVASSKSYYKQRKDIVMRHIGCFYLRLYFLFCLHLCPKWFACMIMKKFIRALKIFQFLFCK